MSLKVAQTKIYAKFRLEPREFEIMKTHTTLGYDAIVHAENALGTNVDFLSFAKTIALSHQEKWDGSGYPQGLAGDDIPIAARLMAVADVYDALISRRVYKEGMAHEKAVQIMIDGRGTHFDADMFDAFIDIQEEFRTIARRFVDSNADMDKKKEYLAQADAV
jgi:putative two-component system response regulator